MKKIFSVLLAVMFITATEGLFSANTRAQKPRKQKHAAAKVARTKQKCSTKKSR